MNAWRDSLILTIISCLILTGCQLDPPAKTVAEYRPSNPPAEMKAPDSEVFVLWRWQQVSPTSTGPTTKPTRQFPVEIQQVYANRGSPVGFRHAKTQLLAVAGSTTIPIDQAHYTWRTLPGSSTRTENRRSRFDKIVTCTLAVIGVAVVVVLVLVLVHDGRHTLGDDVFNSD